MRLLAQQLILFVNFSQCFHERHRYVTAVNANLAHVAIRLLFVYQVLLLSDLAHQVLDAQKKLNFFLLALFRFTSSSVCGSMIIYFSTVHHFTCVAKIVNVQEELVA